MRKNFKNDVFISYSSKDKQIVNEIAIRLKADGISVWLDKWEIKVGDSIPVKIERALEDSRALLLFMSANSFSSDWVTLERQTALFRDPINIQRRFIPLRLDNSEIPDVLKQYAYVDWREKSEKEYNKLLTACRLHETTSDSIRDQKGELKPSADLKGHNRPVLRIAISADGSLAVSSSHDNTVRVWDLKKNECLSTLFGHTNSVVGVAVTPDGNRAVTGSHDRSVRIWDLVQEECIAELRGHSAAIVAVAVTDDGSMAVTGSLDDTIKVWDLYSNKCVETFTGHTDQVLGVAVASKVKIAVSCSKDTSVRVWDLVAGKCTHKLTGHSDAVTGVAITPDASKAISGSNDKTLRIWDLLSGRCVGVLEGHTENLIGVAISANGRLAVSSSHDGTIRAWDLDFGSCISLLKHPDEAPVAVALSPDGKVVVSGSTSGTVQIWNLPVMNGDLERKPGEAKYTNAKVLLVGDSGVGKSALAIRLTQDRFVPTISTDGAWATHIRLPQEVTPNILEKDIWLWDFGGQADYRLIHQLFMEDTALAVLVFDPQNDNPFEGLGRWANDIQRSTNRALQKLLVAGRCDRGGLTVSRKSIDSFVLEHGFAAYIQTSANTGVGCSELKSLIVENIAWDKIPWTSSPRIFKQLKEAVLSIKEEKVVLLRVNELRQRLEMKLPREKFTFDQIRAVIALLVSPGAVWQLKFGDFILLQPEMINAYASAVIRSIRSHMDEIGCIAEEDLLAGKLDYQDMERLPLYDEQIILRAMHQTFVDHGLCLREYTDAGTMLVFPSYFRRERPDQEDHPTPFVTYQISGPLDEIYATLVVRLIYTAAFEQDQLWKNAADFKTYSGKRLGLRMNKLSEGSAEITVYFDPEIPDDTKVTFMRYIHEHLRKKDQNLKRTRHYVCPKCSEAVESYKAIRKRLEDGKKTISCLFCDYTIPLVDLIEEKFSSDEFRILVRKLEERSRTHIDSESQELIMIGHAFSTASEAGQIFRPIKDSDWGIDGEIEFIDYDGKASGKRIYLQFKYNKYYSYHKDRDGNDVFVIKKVKYAEHWINQNNPVMLLFRKHDGEIWWMNIMSFLLGSSIEKKVFDKNREVKIEKSEEKKIRLMVKKFVFSGEPFTALSVQRMRDKLIPQVEEIIGV